MKIFNQDLTYQLYFLRIHGSEKYYSRKKIDLFFGFWLSLIIIYRKLVLFVFVPIMFFMLKM